MVLTLWHKTLPREAVLVLDEVPAHIFMFLVADVVNYAWKLSNQLKGFWLEVEACMKVMFINPRMSNADNL